MALSSLNLLSSAGINAPLLERQETGISPIQAPQSFTHAYGYTLGSSGVATLNGVVYEAVILNGGSSTTINLVTGTNSDPTGDMPVNIATLKEVFIAVPASNPDDDTDTPAAGVTVAFNAAMMAAMGWAGGAASKTMVPLQRFTESNPTGQLTGVDASITITNLSATDKTTVYVAFAGFRV